MLAGADIKEMSERTFSQNINDDFLGNWGQVYNIRKPIIAAVNGFAVSLFCIYYQYHENSWVVVVN